MNVCERAETYIINKTKTERDIRRRGKRERDGERERLEKEKERKIRKRGSRERE